MFIATLIAFTVYQMAPGGPLQFLDDDPSSTSADMDRLERHYGLDRSIAVQYVTWMTGEDWVPKTETWRGGQCLANPKKCGKGIVRLDFGRSFSFKGESVIDLPFTAGAWAASQPVTLTLKQGKNVLRLWRDFPPQYGVAVRAFTLKPSR